jgi:GNAT superfamily N-acetyltransferase
MSGGLGFTRQAILADLEYIRRVRKTAFPNSVGDAGHQDDHLIIEDGAMYVHEVNGLVVGYGELDLMNSEAHAIGVLPDYRKKGIARRILNELEARAREIGIVELRSTANSLEGVALLESAGWILAPYQPRNLPKDGPFKGGLIKNYLKRL